MTAAAPRVTRHPHPRRPVVLVVLTTLLSATSTATSAPSAAATSGPGGGNRFVPVSPYRVLDTRSSPSVRLGPGGTVVGLVGDGGSTAAVAANTTVPAVQPSGSTYLQAHRNGVPVPSTSTVNALPGEVVANATRTAVTDDLTAACRVRNIAGSIDVVVDVSGWFVPE